MAALAFGVSFVAFRKKRMPVRLLGGVVLGLAFIGVFLALIILGGDAAQSDAITYTEKK